MGYLELSRSYTPQSTGVRIDEFNESEVKATITDIELRMQLVEQARQAHHAWFACWIGKAALRPERVSSVGYPRTAFPAEPIGRRHRSDRDPMRPLVNMSIPP